MKRRLPAIILMAVLFLGALAIGRTSNAEEVPVFGTVNDPWMPHGTEAGGLTEAWFCPGVPAAGADGVDGEIKIANRNPSPLNGTVLLYNEQGGNKRVPLIVPAFSVSTVQVAQELPGAITAAVVEIEGGGALVEQISRHPAGDSYAACANSTGDAWYLADGFTVDGSLDQVLLSNPYDQPVVARVEFAVEGGYRTPASYSSLAVPARSVRVIDLGAPGAGAQGENLLAVAVQATRGRLVVGRAQQFKGGGRTGESVTLASPGLSDQWRFAGGRIGEGVSERYSIFNPTDDPVDLETVLLGYEPAKGSDGAPIPIEIDPIHVPARSVVSFDLSSIKDFPGDSYAIVFSTLDKPSVVVERATTLSAGSSTHTSVIAGATSRPTDSYLATQWHVPSGPDDATEGALVLHSIDAQEGKLTVYAVGASGPVAVPSLTDVVLPASSAVLRLDLTDPAVIGRELIVQTTNRVLVEQWYPSGVGSTRTVSWAVPAG